MILTPKPYGALKKLRPDSRQAAMDCLGDYARRAYEEEGPSTFLLPSATVTAFHEAGHAVIYAALDNPPAIVRIWYEPRGAGFSGENDFPPDAPLVKVHPLEQPREAVEQVCSLLAGWCAEQAFTPDRLKAGSSLDEVAVATGLGVNAAQALGYDPERLLDACRYVTYGVLKFYANTVIAIQRRLVVENRIRGRKLADLLSAVRPVDLVGLVIERIEKPATARTEEVGHE